MSSNGGIVGTVKRAALGVATGGLSEYAIAGGKLLKGDVKGGGMGLLTSGTGAYGGIAGAAGAATEKKAEGLPEPPAAVTTPTTDSPAVQQAGAWAAQKAASRRGFRSTILSSMASQTPALRTTLGA